MFILTFIISILLIFLLLLVLIPFKITFSVISEQESKINLIFSWISPFLKGELIDYSLNHATFAIYLFNKKVGNKNFKFKFKNNNTNKLDIFKSIIPKYVNIETYYGFEDPSITGFLCGIINLIPDYSEASVIYNNPDFTTDTSYFNGRGVIKINIFSAIIKLINSNTKNNSKISYNK